MGGGLARVAWKAFAEAATALRDGGLDYLDMAMPGGDLDHLMRG